MTGSLRKFLGIETFGDDIIEGFSGNQFIDNGRPFSSVNYEIAAYARKACNSGGKAIFFRYPINLDLFEHCQGNIEKYMLISSWMKNDEFEMLESSKYEGLSAFDIPVVAGVFSNPNNVLRCLDPGYGPTYIDQPMVEAVKRYSYCASVSNTDKLGNHCTILSNDAPCQDVILVGDQIRLSSLPICWHNEKDSGKFVTAGVQVVKWIDGVTHGLGIHRMKVVDDKTLSCLAPPNRRIGFPHYESKSEGVKMAVVIGAPPEVILASQAKLKQDCEKYIVASNLQDEFLELVQCVTSDLLVPAHAEIVLECTTIGNSLYDDTPFGEYPGTYSYRSNSFLVHVDAITMRKNPLYHTILTGQLPQEDSNLCAIPYSAEVYSQALKSVEVVTDISVFLGNNVFDTIVCIDKKSNEQVQNLMYSLLGNKYLKSVTVMDKDLKADEEGWRFAFNTRYQPNRDTIITNLALGASLDPSSPLFQSTSKIGFDFTVPIGQTESDTEFNRFRHSIAKTVDFPWI